MSEDFNQDNIESWLTWMYTNHTKAIRLGLEKLLPIASSLNISKFSCPVIVVGGTNGKGSCVKVIESILLNAKLNVGVYTSPHLYKYNERIRINGQDISDTECISAFKTLRQYTEKHNSKLTFFEFGTLSALLNFKEHDLDVIILEVGLGGRLDAVNIVENDIAIITSIDIDHTDFLGDTIEQIATEKSGIFKQNKIAICGDNNPPIVVSNIAKAKNTEYYLLNRDYFAEDIDANNWQYSSKQQVYKLPKPNLLLQNTATAIKAVEILPTLLKQKLNKKISFSRDIIAKSIAYLRLKGRFEIIKHNGVEVILDVAHNHASAVNLAKSINKLPKKKNIAIFSIQDNKAIEDVITPFKDIIDIWQIIDINAPRAIPKEILKKKVSKIVGPKANLSESTIQIFETKYSSNDVRFIAFGSFYTVSETARLLEAKNGT